MAVSTMTMKNMDEYIESKGYIVTRTYVPEKRLYKFVISNGEFRKEYWWKYEPSESSKIKSADNMLKDFVASKKRWEPFNLASRGLIGDIEHGYEYVDDLSTIDDMIKYVEREGDFDEVTFERAPMLRVGVFNLRKRDFHMKYMISDATLGSIDDRVKKMALDEMIEKFNPWETRFPISKDCKDYIEEDIKMTKQIVNSIYGDPAKKIKDVIFNDPATIVFWTDGSKTVVKTQNGEPFDKEKGLAMAITKKFLGNQGNYYETMKKWLK